MIDLRLSKKLFNDVYYPYLTQYNEPVEIFYGGSGSGKSVFVAQKLLYKALNDKRKILVIRKVGTSQKESCWALMKSLLAQWKIYDYCEIRVSDMTITLPNGSVFLFKGLDDPERIKSIVGITDIWCEEATELTEVDFDQLTLRIRSLVDDLQIFLSFNPISKASWCYKRWFIENPKEKPFILKTTYKDNRFLPKDYIERLENLINTNPTYYRIYTLGEFCSLDKLIFTNWEVQEFEVDNKLPLLVGLDWGYTNDLTALVASVIDEKNSIIYVFKEWTATGKTNPEIADAIKALGFSKSIIIADSSEPKSIEEVKQCGIPRIKGAKKPKGSVNYGIQRLQQFKIIVHPSCENLITELGEYSWKKDKQSGEYINEPVDMWNHSIDALRYSLQCQGRKLKTISKSAIGV